MDAGREPSFVDAVEAFGRALPRLKPAERDSRIAGLRRMASRQGLAAAVEVVDGLAAAMAREPRATPFASWIDALGHAARSGAGDAPVLLATIGVRFAA